MLFAARKARTAKGESTDSQPRYAAYARNHRCTPEKILAHDRDAYPGGCMCGFTLWISATWAVWAKDSGEVSKGPDKNWSSRQHNTLDAWLASIDRDPVDIPVH